MLWVIPHVRVSTYTPFPATNLPTRADGPPPRSANPQTPRLSIGGDARRHPSVVDCPLDLPSRQPTVPHIFGHLRSAPDPISRVKSCWRGTGTHDAFRLPLSLCLPSRKRFLDPHRGRATWRLACPKLTRCSWPRPSTTVTQAAGAARAPLLAMLAMEVLVIFVTYVPIAMSVPTT